MATGTRICKVCGCEYPYCRTSRPTGIFRWQDVACCPEHGSIYFAEVAASRGETFEGLEGVDALAPVAASVEDNREDIPFDYEDDDDYDEDGRCSRTTRTTKADIASAILP